MFKSLFAGIALLLTVAVLGGCPGFGRAPEGMVLIPAGTFQMGDSFSEGSSNELPVHGVDLAPYFIDKFEVTNAEYAAALNWAYAQGGLIEVSGGVVYKYDSGTSYPYCDTTTSEAWSQITWDGSTFGVAAGKENYPVVGVTWYGAAACANWRSGMEGRPLSYDVSNWTCNFGAGGYRLPTEAEWEKAARGGAVAHRFPWSDTDMIQHGRANYYSTAWDSYDTSPTSGHHPEFAVAGPPRTSPVGYFAPNGYGLYDMAGNVTEWCNDWYSESYYSSSPSSDPTGPATSSSRVHRGGDWYDGAYNCRCAQRGGDTPGYRYHYFGLRLVADAK
jgi:formylglycine-generating enzyme required for sulfatase activity